MSHEEREKLCAISLEAVRKHEQDEFERVSKIALSVREGVEKHIDDKVFKKAFADLMRRR